MFGGLVRGWSTWSDGVPFQNEFEACLLYLRDFMETLDVDDVNTIQALGIHRNELAHDLPTGQMATIYPIPHFLPGPVSHQVQLAAQHSAPARNGRKRICRKHVNDERSKDARVLGRKKP